MTSLLNGFAASGSIPLGSQALKIRIAQRLKNGLPNQ
jgi:hypothetical protein